MQTGRRTFIKHALAGSVTLTGLAGILHSRQAPAAIRLRLAAPEWRRGACRSAMSLGDRAIVWSRADGRRACIVEWSRDESFARAVTLRGPHALEASDFTARIDLTGLPADSDIFVRVIFESLDSGTARSEPVVGQLPHAAREAPRRPLRVVRRHRRPGLGHQSRLRRHEDLRGHAPARGRISSSIPATPSTPTAR